MFARRLIAIFLGALLLGSMLGAAPVQKSSPHSPKECSCCEGLSVCPCAASGGERQPSLPVLPPSQEQQLQILAPGTTDLPDIEPRAGPKTLLEKHLPATFCAGFRGVSLQAAFCRYTI